RASASVPRVTLDYRDTMRAMVLEGPGPKRLTSADREIPIALPGEIRVRVRACGVCRTDLHLVDGDLRDGEFPIIPGHEIVGVVDQLGDGVTEFAVGDRVGIPWLGYSCGACGFGAAAHLIAQLAVYQGKEVFAFTSPGDDAAQTFARSLGCAWAGASTETPPSPMDAVIVFAPVGALVPTALAHLMPGGVVVCAGIHMSDIPSFPYSLLWQERVIRSVANLTRQDALEFLTIAPKVPIKTHVQSYAIGEANRALDDLRGGRVTGAAVLTV